MPPHCNSVGAFEKSGCDRWIPRPCGQPMRIYASTVNALEQGPRAAVPLCKAIKCVAARFLSLPAGQLYKAISSSESPI